MGSAVSAVMLFHKIGASHTEVGNLKTSVRYGAAGLLIEWELMKNANALCKWRSHLGFQPMSASWPSAINQDSMLEFIS